MKCGEEDGGMIYVGHHDLLRMLSRACRRASLPISSSESEFNARPNIKLCLASPLGATCSEDLLEIILTEERNINSVMKQLQVN